MGGSGMVPLERAGSPGRAGSGVETRLNMVVPPKTLNWSCGPHPVALVRAHYVEMSKCVCGLRGNFTRAAQPLQHPAKKRAVRHTVARASPSSRAVVSARNPQIDEGRPYVTPVPADIDRRKWRFDQHPAAGFDVREWRFDDARAAVIVPPGVMPVAVAAPVNLHNGAIMTGRRLLHRRQWCGGCPASPQDRCRNGKGRGRTPNHRSQCNLHLR